MKYYSTNKKSPLVDFREATIRGQAPDKGLYFPEHIPTVDKDLLRNIERFSDHEIAFRVMRPFVGESIPEEKLFEIVRETLCFPVPLVQLDEAVFTLELFHGPTLAFKDVGARFMSRCIREVVLSGQTNTTITVLVATSGDTGGAVADGFYGVEGVNVVILYPSGKVSPVQEKQLTTYGKNITALEVEGNFDDCQQMVKQAFADTTINKRLFLTSANSINIARWLPQQFFYFLACKQWPDKNNPPVIAVPSGNFGNIAAGMLAMRSGLPIRHFVAACNSNGIAAGFLETGKWQPRKANPTISNAMDVGDPSNFIRIMEMFGNDFNDLTQHLSSVNVNDEMTMTAIKEMADRYQYIADPHGAVGSYALQQWLQQNPGNQGIFLETAHPVKFPDAVEAATGQKIPVPASMKEIMQKEKQCIIIKPLFSELNDYLLSRS